MIYNFIKTYLKDLVTESGFIDLTSNMIFGNVSEQTADGFIEVMMKSNKTCAFDNHTLTDSFLRSVS